MFCIKKQMKKYLSVLFIAFSAVTFAQFQDNLFEKEKATAKPTSEISTNAEAETTLDVDASSADEGNPGNPGDEPVPIDDYLPVLLLSGFALVVYYQRRNKEINI